MVVKFQSDSPTQDKLSYFSIYFACYDNAISVTEIIPVTYKDYLERNLFASFPDTPYVTGIISLKKSTMNFETASTTLLFVP